MIFTALSFLQLIYNLNIFYKEEMSLRLYGSENFKFRLSWHKS